MDRRKFLSRAAALAAMPALSPLAHAATYDPIQQVGLHGADYLLVDDPVLAAWPGINLGDVLSFEGWPGKYRVVAMAMDGLSLEGDDA